MNVPWPKVSRFGQVRRLRLEREVRPVDDLARRAHAVDRRDAGVDERDVDARARVARAQKSCAPVYSVVEAMEFTSALGS